MARRAEEVGAAKATTPALRLFVLAVLGGAFIAFGAGFATVAATGAVGSLGFGPTRVLGGLVFSVGLVLVVVAGAELFTGNNLLVLAVVARRVSITAMLRNWAIVYAGNLVGAVGTAWLVFVARQYEGAANMYFLPIALFVKDGAPASYWTSVGTGPDAYEDLTWWSALVDNLVPVTFGNIIGGAVLVGLVYAFVYRRAGTEPA